VKALLIDNYDSFTYNLFHLWMAVSGDEPVVIHHDDWHAWNSIDLASFEAVLISPGPGRPDRPQDFGISQAGLVSGLPVLGVCLGHQGLCFYEGGSVVAAPEPMHGRASPIVHDGTGLFAGLPSPFDAIRYHSLMVADLPPALEVTATTPGPPGAADIVMAVQHRAKSQWGVQFHPESIATEHGHRLLANFCRLAARDRGVRVTRPVSVPPPPRSHHQRPGRGMRLLRRRIAGEPDLPALFSRLFTSPRRYWLDGSAVPTSQSRYSIMGGAGPMSEWVTAHAASGYVNVEPASGPTYRVDGDVFDFLRAQLEARAIAAPELPSGFALGYVGFLGYELKADCGGDAAHVSDLPDAGFLFSDRGVVVDHHSGETWLLALADDGTETASRDWLQDAAVAVARATPARYSAGPSADGPPLAVRYRHSPEQYEGLVQACQAEIRAGESYEINLTNELTVDSAADPFSAFLELRRVSPAPYSALLEFGEVSVVSASPERYLRITADGHVQTKPIKGTRRRGDDPVDDADLARDLGQSPKDRAENLMIVDLLRNDLGVVAEPGTVQVTRLFDVETFAAVHQLVSTVEAQLRPDVSPVDCVRAAFPGGSMTGAPKRRTMQIIDRLEGGGRGVYSGALGYFSLTGAVDLSIVIRTLVVYPDRVTLGVGGAVTALSDPRTEVEEMLLKAKAPLRALARAMAHPAGKTSVGL
jgi:para-aminobenzoate synthetase